jgi:hypothetical protein
MNSSMQSDDGTGKNFIKYTKIDSMLDQSTLLKDS